MNNALEYAESIFETVRGPMIVLDSELKVLRVNRNFYNTFRVLPEETIGHFIYDLGNRQWDIPRLRVLLEEILPQKTVLNDYEVEHDFTIIGRKTILLNARQIFRKETGSHRILLAMEDITERKQAEENLIKSEALYHSLVDTSQDLIWQCDAEGRYTYLNLAWEQVFGYDLDEMIGKKFSDFQTPEDAAFSLSEFNRLLEGNSVKSFNGTHIGKSGNKIYLVFNAVFINDENGNIVGTSGTGYDITDRKRMEDELLDGSALVQTILNTVVDGIITIRAHGGVIETVNPAVEQMFGYSASELTRLNFGILIPGLDRDQQNVSLDHYCVSVEARARGMGHEVMGRRKDGGIFPLEISLGEMQLKGHRYFTGILRDLTPRKQIESEQFELAQRLRDHQFYTRSLFESNIDAIMTTDPFGIITDVNKQMELLTGCTRDEMTGAPFRNYFTDPERAEAGIKLVLVDKKVTNYELTAYARDGRETVVSFNATTFYDRYRKLQGVFAAARDITERKQLDQELESAKFVAEKANLAKSDFLSSMSHELRTPLGAILGFAQLLESGSPPPHPHQKRSIDQILRAGWHLLELINEILDLALIESGKLPMSLEPVLLPEIMGECEIMIEPQAKKRGISVNFTHFDTPLFVRADRMRVKQVLINLLSNAIKYNRVGGKVVVESALRQKNSIRISVRDTGEGLSPEQLAQLFQPFNRLGQEDNSEQGTGIGLTVSKRLIESMGGIIGVESTVGKGSVFWIELELTIEPQTITDVADEATSVRVQDGVQLYNLLCVEDNPANLMLVEDIIARRTDIHLLSARDGKSGIELARAFLPDVILMDINLPDISGVQALKILAGDPTTAQIPVVALSANAVPRDIENGLEAGFFRYLTKPIRVNEFMDTVDVALNYAKEKAAHNSFRILPGRPQ